MSSNEPLKSISSDHRKGHHLIVEYPDGTAVVYLVEQLSELRPHQTVSASSHCQPQTDIALTDPAFAGGVSFSGPSRESAISFA